MAAPDALLDTLNEDQRAAVTHDGGGPLQVIAGAGTGKTRVLVGRVAWLIRTGRARPEEICAGVHERRRERDRVAAARRGRSHGRARVGGDEPPARGPAAPRPRRSFGRTGSFSIWGRARRRRRPARRARAAGPSRSRLSRASARARERTGCTRRIQPRGRGRAATACWPPSRRMSAPTARRAGSTSTTSCATRVIALESDGALRAACGRRFAHVLVDEFQDLNPAQYRLAALLAREHRRLTVLGDPRQAICAYRGATSAENFAAFASDFADATTVALGRTTALPD